MRLHPMLADGPILTAMPALAALPVELLTTRPPPAALDSVRVRPKGLSTSTCQHHHG